MELVRTLLPVLPITIYAFGARGWSPWWGVAFWGIVWAIAALGKGRVTDGYDSTARFRASLDRADADV